MSDLPRGWVETELKAIVKTRKGKKPNILQDSQGEGFIPYLDIHAIEKSIFRQYAEASTSRIGTDKDLFVVWDGARSGWVGFGKNGAIGSTIMALETLVADQTFLFHFLKSQFDYLNSNTRGTGIPHVDPQVFNNLQVPLPPLNEQKRIVAKLEALLSRVDTSKERLEKIPKILKRFRQSVLAAACSGKLTVDWRANEEINLDNDFPNKWNITNLRNLTTLVTSGSRGWADFYSDTGSIFVRAQNINSDQLVLDDVAYVKLPTNSEGRRTKIVKDDLLITITGANVTKSARVCLDLDDAYVSQHVALVRLADKQLSEYVYLWIISPQHGRKDLLDSAYGAGKPGLNLDNIRSLSIALPPLPEQKEIVRRVEDLFKFADSIEERFKQAKAQVDKLTNSILAKAFRGELVGQDETDEPASVLLERIKADKETNQEKTPGKRKAVSQGKLF